MIRPTNFGYNTETAVNNAFQIKNSQENVQAAALQEFDQFVEKLSRNGVDVTVVDDTPEPYTPDSIFPNNWVSFHSDGTVFLYPMFAPNRRLERKPGVMEAIGKKFSISRTIDLSGYENDNLFLEGTGSMVLDRGKKLAYACLSPRTHSTILEEFCSKAGYTPVSFRSVDEKSQEIYHTNVMMCVADAFVVICLESIPDEAERKMVADIIEKTGKAVINISPGQMNHFAGNMLQVANQAGEKILVMSSQAFESLSPAQMALLESFNPILHSPLETIERNGGGSARCMMAEIFLPLR